MNRFTKSPAAPTPATPWESGTAERTSDGLVELRFTLEGDDHLQRLATTLAKLLVPTPPKTSDE